MAKLGLLAQLEAQVKSSVLIAIKAIEGLSFEEWCKLESKPFEQLIKRLKTGATGLDQELSDLVDVVANDYATALICRHQNLHSLWAWNPSVGEARAYDMKRNQKLAAGGLDGAMDAVADLTFKTKRCVYRVAQMTAESILPERTEGQGPNMKVGEVWVRL